MKPRLCLTMIVKDEAAIIERALQAAAPHIACYVICDTGSTDDTVGIIRRTFEAHGVPGEVVSTTFENFEQARNEGLEAARASRLEYDYLLFCDADMELRVHEGGLDVELTEPVYNLTQVSANSELGYQNVRLLRRDVPGRYLGVTHEYLDAGTLPHPHFEGAWFLDHAAGSSRANKFERDIQLLTKALATDHSNARYVFYLAQSYRDSGDLPKALRTYERRVELGGWEEEVWYAKLQVALLTERLGRSYASVVEAYLDAYQSRPTRAEPLMHLARYHREHGARYALAHLFALQAIAIPRPPDVLFVDEGTYHWRAKDEYAIACYWTGRYRESVAACQELLASGVLPEAQRARVTENLNFSLQRVDSAG